MNKKQRLFLLFPALLLALSADTVLARDLSPRQKLILQVPEGHRLEGAVTIMDDQKQTRAIWRVSHASDFGPVEVIEMTQGGVKLLIFSHGERLNRLVVFAEFFGPYVPVFSGKFDESGNMYDEVKKEGQQKFSPEELKEVSALALRATQDVLSFFSIRSDKELAAYIKSQKFGTQK